MQPAFILSHQWHDTPKGMTLELWCASTNGPICVEIPQQEAVFFIAATEAEPAFNLLGKYHYRIGEARLKNYLNEPVLPLYFLSYKHARDAQYMLNDAGVRTWEADIRPPERYLMERFITGSMQINTQAATHVARQDKTTFYQNPQLSRGAFKPALRMVSIDIETNMEASQLFSIGIYSDHAAVVFMVGQGPSTTADDFELIYFANEKSCLIAFFSWLKDYDPDVLIGWNFIQFDLKVLANLCQKNSITLDIGRANKSINWREDKSTNRYYIQIPGRVALDGIELLKAAFYNFPSFKLERVAQALLGEGKLISGNDGGQQITELFNNDKPALARYNLQDCKLVWDIFEKAHLMDFCIARSQLTGLLMDKMGGSVAAFEFAYLPKLHRQGYVAPNLGELHSDIISPGGYVLDSIPGIYHNILVLDFKSLYPSIIRTFHIDPYAFWVAEHNALPAAEIIPGFNGAFFSKQQHLLPDIIKTLWQARDQAKLDNNQPLSQAIKIIMNSFYGVLGSTGCRFFDPRVCSSITLRGHQILQQTQHWIEAQGHQVIYGDTDSVFVWVGNHRSEQEALEIGQYLALTLNQNWQQKLRADYDITSALEIEFETHYLKFLMPTIRNSTQGSKKRYAGLINKKGVHKIIFKGLENVRTDWTDLAKNFQQTLYTMVFNGDAVEAYIQKITHEVLSGQRDHELVYAKRLRQHLEQYQKNVPPHVQAARKLPLKQQPKRGETISYFLTVNGPEPITDDNSKPASAIAYDEYIERQLKPVADSVLQFIGLNFEEVTSSQMNLF